MLKGYHKQGFRLDSRLPITLPAFHKLLDSACTLTICRYQVCQFKAMSSRAFYAFLRVGEMASTSSVVSPPSVQIGQLFKLTDDLGNTIALRLVFATCRHSFNQRPVPIVIHRQRPFCPVQRLLYHLGLCGNQPGPLFPNPDNTTVSRNSFKDFHYNGHSFRTGAASCAADRESPMSG